MKSIFAFLLLFALLPSTVAFADPTDADEQVLLEENIRKPIVYGQGAAGITLETTYEESKTLLTPPERGPLADGITFYNEQVVVIWNQDSAGEFTTPLMIIPVSGYLGKMTTQTLGQVDYQTKYPDLAKEGEEGAIKLTQLYYQEFENDWGKDCFELEACQLIYGDPNQANFVIVLPKGVFLFAKEEFQLAEMRIVSTSRQ